VNPQGTDTLSVPVDFFLCSHLHVTVLHENV
jgi:hypothetical protein